MQTQIIPFTKGIDTISNDTQSAGLQTLENCVFSKLGEISKRNGYSKLSNQIWGSPDNIINPIASQVYNNTQLVLFDNNYIYSYIDSLNSFSNRGTCTSVDTELNKIITNSYSQTNTNITTFSNITLVAWEDSSNGVRYSLFDNDSNTNISNNNLIKPDALNPIPLNHIGLDVIYSTSDNRVRITNVSTNINYNYTTTLCVDLNNTFAAIAQDQVLELVFNHTDNTTRFIRFNSNYNIINQTSVAHDSDNALHIKKVNTSDGYTTTIISNTSSNELKIYLVDDSLNSKVYTITGITASTITSYFEDDILEIYYDDRSGAYPIIYKIIYNTLTDYISLSELIRGITLSSHVFNSNNRRYFLADYTSIEGIQSSTFLINSLGEVASKANDRLGPGARSTLSNVININNILSIGTSTLGKIISDITGTYGEHAIPGASVIKLDFNVNYSSVNINKSLILTGGILQQYDGVSVNELGYNYYPENIQYSLSSGSLSGTYSYLATYEWDDASGKTDRSAGSIPIQLNLSNNSVNLTIPTLKLTKKQNVRIVIYRTLAATSGNPLFYRITETNSPLLNDPTINTISFTDNNSDNDIRSNDIYYASPDTSGYPIQLENIPAPNCTLIAEFNNRLFVAGSNNDNIIYFSKTYVDGEIPSFNDVLKIKINDEGGPIKGLSSTDSSLIIFKENSIYVIQGNGPDNTGNGSFSDAIKLTSDVGCINTNSIATVASFGTLFQSRNGIYLLDRNLSTSYFGAKVKKYQNQTIVAATSIPGTSEVRFACSDGNTLVYNYFFNEWSVFTNHISIDAGIYQGNYYHVKPDGHVYLSNDSFIDDTNNITMKVKTSRLGFGDIQGTNKVNGFMLLGNYIGKHSLTFNIFYNNKIIKSDTRIRNTTDIFDINTYGEQDIYGNNSPYGGTFDGISQFYVNLRKLCQNVQIEIIVDDIDGNSGCINLVALSFDYQPKNQSAKIKSDRHM